MESGPSKRLFYFWYCFGDWCVFPAHNFCFSFNLFVNHSLVFNCVFFICWSADLFLSRVPFFVGVDAEIEKSKTMSKPSYELKGFPCEGIAKISYICNAAKLFAMIKQIFRQTGSLDKINTCIMFCSLEFNHVCFWPVLCSSRLKIKYFTKLTLSWSSCKLKFLNFLLYFL